MKPTNSVVVNQVVIGQCPVCGYLVSVVIKYTLMANSMSFTDRRVVSLLVSMNIEICSWLRLLSISLSTTSSAVISKLDSGFFLY